MIRAWEGNDIFEEIKKGNTVQNGDYSFNLKNIWSFLTEYL